MTETISGEALKAAKEAAKAEREGRGEPRVERYWKPTPEEIKAAGAAAVPAVPSIFDGDCSRWVGREPEPLKFTITDMVPEGMVTLLVAEGGAGKSILLQTACTCIPTGRLFLGHSTTSGQIAAVFAEDTETVLHLRQTRINTALGIDMADLTNRSFIQSYSGFDATLWADYGPTEFMGELERRLVHFQELRLLVLDNVALLYAGGENDRLEVTAFINMLNGLAQRLRCGILLSTHQSKSTDGTLLRIASGTTAWVNACRSVLELKPEREDEPPALRLRKANHTKPGLELPLEWRDGVLLAKHEESATVRGIRERSAKRVFMEMLDAVTREGRNVSDHKNSSNYAPRLFSGRPGREGFTKADFAKAMELLFADGAIEMQDYGRRGDCRKRIARKGELGAEDLDRDDDDNDNLV